MVYRMNGSDPSVVNLGGDGPHGVYDSGISLFGSGRYLRAAICRCPVRATHGLPARQAMYRDHNHFGLRWRIEHGVDWRGRWHGQSGPDGNSVLMAYVPAHCAGADRRQDFLVQSKRPAFDLGRRPAPPSRTAE